MLLFSIILCLIGALLVYSAVVGTDVAGVVAEWLQTP